MGLLASYLLDSANRSRAQDYAAQQYGADSPQAAFANAFPSEFAATESQKYQKQAEGNAIAQFYGGGQQSQPQQQQIPQGMPQDADSALQQMQQPQQQQAQPDQSALQRYQAMAYLPAGMQAQAAQQLSLQGIMSGGANSAINSDLHGDEFLQTLPSTVGSMVKGYAEGKMPIPTSGRNNSQFQALQPLIEQYDPTFDGIDYKTRVATRKDFTSGTSAKSINALNTLAQHLSALKESSDNLGNGSVPFFNSIGNAVSTAFGGPSVPTYDLNSASVAEEATRAWRGAGGAESDIQRYLDSLGHDQSPQQFKATTNKLGELVSGKIDALQDQYKRGMGTAAQDTNFYTPAAAKSFQALGVNVPNAPEPRNALQQQASPSPLAHLSDDQLLQIAKQKGLVK